jgi:hypothetical protein
MSSQIKLECRNCGDIVIVPKHCPYTGIMHGSGWHQTCTECRGEMVEVPAKYTCLCDKVLQEMEIERGKK